MAGLPLDASTVALWRCATSALAESRGQYTPNVIVGLSAASQVAGVLGDGALTFDGSSSARGPADSALCTALLGEWTIEVVAYFDIRQLGPLFSLHDSSGRRIVELRQSYDQILVAWNSDPNPGVVWNTATSGTGALSTGWRYIAVRKTISGGLCQYEFFVGSVSKGVAGAYALPPAWTTGPTFRICDGSTATGDLGRFTGTLDEIRISSIARSNTEITAGATLLPPSGDKAATILEIDSGIVHGATRYGLRYSRPITGNAMVSGDATGVIVEADDIFLVLNPVVVQPPSDAGFTLGTPTQQGASSIRIPIAVTPRIFKIWNGSAWV